ncbi:MAG: hypothetical protein Q4F96_01075 [Bacillota bacterium]|nr:hypothetical protein [Bacillota bacterium]
MKIEVLFPEICNLYGDLANLRYLKLCLPEAEVLETTLRSKPRFLDGDTDLVYMGTTTEEGQRLVLEQLMFYRGEILDSIQAGQRFLITGNAMELFGERIEEDGEEVLRGLGDPRSTGSTASLWGSSPQRQRRLPRRSHPKRQTRNPRRSQTQGRAGRNRSP